MTEACHVSKHQRGRPAGITGWWGVKCIWHNRFLWWCHDRTSSTDLARDSTLFEEHRPWFLVAFLGALIPKDATMASAHTTVQEHVGHLTHHDPFGCDQKQFYMCDESYWLVGASSRCAWCRLAEIPTGFNTQIISALVHRQGGDSYLHTKHVITHNVM